MQHGQIKRRVIIFVQKKLSGAVLSDILLLYGAQKGKSTFTDLEPLCLIIQGGFLLAFEEEEEFKWGQEV